MKLKSRKEKRELLTRLDSVTLFVVTRFFVLSHIFFAITAAAAVSCCHPICSQYYSLNHDDATPFVNSIDSMSGVEKYCLPVLFFRSGRAARVHAV